jgi:hypothetical protein
MAGGIYLLGDGDNLLEMNENQYDSEDLLQELLAKYPNLLAGDQINKTDPRRWLLVRKEVPIFSKEGISGTWAADHLFLDQDGIPTIVEVKRSSDSRIRREVVGQMLDYAANAIVYWSLDKIKAFFEANCEKNNLDYEKVLDQFLGKERDSEEFWSSVKTNLQAGKIRLVFVADSIPFELQRIVEFLNEQMDPAEVLALEVKQYVGGKLKTLVPRIIGQTSEAQQKKIISIQGYWNKGKFLDVVKEVFSPEDVVFFEQAIEWVKINGLQEKWGKGLKRGAYYPYFLYRNIEITLFSIWTTKHVEIEFGTLNNRLPAGNEEVLTELLQRINKLEGISLPDNSIKKYPNIAINIMSKENNKDKFFEIFLWFVNAVKNFIDLKV